MGIKDETLLQKDLHTISNLDAESEHTICVFELYFDESFNKFDFLGGI